MKANEAEVCKYVNNFHGALMVIFANFIYDICKRIDADFETVKKAAVASKWVGSPMGRMYWEVFHKGRRGYGGGCFPKDINSLIKWCQENKINSEIIEATQKANVRILKGEGLTEEQAEKGK
jgi:UDPglucose 6-dehydrogenase